MREGVLKHQDRWPETPSPADQPLVTRPGIQVWDVHSADTVIQPLLMALTMTFHAVS
jgi:hypothetical protein